MERKDLIKATFKNLSSPQKTLREMFSRDYDRRIFESDEDDVKYIRRNNSNSTPFTVWLDDKERILRFVDGGIVDTYVFSNDDYLVEEERLLIENGFERLTLRKSYFYRTINGVKVLESYKTTYFNRLVDVIKEEMIYFDDKGNPLGF